MNNYQKVFILAGLLVVITALILSVLMFLESAEKTKTNEIPRKSILVNDIIYQKVSSTNSTTNIFKGRIIEMNPISGQVILESGKSFMVPASSMQYQKIGKVVAIVETTTITKCKTVAFDVEGMGIITVNSTSPFLDLLRKTNATLVNYRITEPNIWEGYQQKLLEDKSAEKYGCKWQKPTYEIWSVDYLDSGKSVWEE